MTKVLVVATSRKTRGGVTSVVKAHEQGKQWQKYHCKWIETHRDGNAIIKILYLVRGLIEYIFLLPFYDIVHIHFSEPPSAIRKRYFFLPLAKLIHKKVIVHFHSFSPETTFRSKYHKIYEYIFKNADKVIVLSNYWKTEISKDFVLGDKLMIIYNPCTIEKTEATYTQKKNILFAAAMTKRKGYDDMIKAFATIASKYPDWNIVFAGSGDDETASNLVTEYHIENQTIFLGWVNGIQKDKAFKEASIFCLPSYAEGFPMGVLDAWAYGLPVITTPVGGLPDIAKNGENVLLFNPGDIDALAEMMERLICNPSLRIKLSKAAQHLSTGTFNKDVICKELSSLYEQIKEV